MVHHALLEWNDRVVGYRDVLRADLGAALRNVAITDAVRLLQFPGAIFHVQWVHLQRGGVNQKARPDELVVLLMLAQHVADILAEETFYAFAEFLHAVHIRLSHAPGAVRRVGRTRLERLDLFLHPEVPRNVTDQVPDARKGLHRLDGHGLIER